MVQTTPSSFFGHFLGNAFFLGNLKIDPDLLLGKQFMVLQTGQNSLFLGQQIIARISIGNFDFTADDAQRDSMVSVKMTFIVSSTYHQSWPVISACRIRQNSRFAVQLFVFINFSKINP